MILTLITLIPLIILQAINIHNNVNRSIEQKLQSSVEIANVVSSTFYNYIKELWIQEFFLANELTVDVNNTKAIQSYLDDIKDSNETGLERLSWVDPSGIIIASTRKYMIGQSVTERDYYKRIMSGEDMVIGNLIKSYVDEAIVVPVVRGIRKEGKLIGIVVSSISPEPLVSHIPNLKLNNGEILVFIDSNENIVYNTKYNAIAFEDRKVPQDNQGWEILKEDGVKVYKSKTKIDGSYLMGVNYPMKEIGWGCSIVSNRDIVLKTTYEQAVQSIIFLILVSTISLFVAYVWGKKISKPLIMLKSKADDLKQGNYSVRTNIKGYDEIAATAEAFDHMADSIEQYDKLKSQFFSNLSHEFKTPINVIYSSVQLIESLENSLDYKEFKNKTIENMKCIRQNCYRLMRLVDNMIDVTRYDTGLFNMNLSNLDIVGIIENISFSVVEFAERKGITIIFDTDVEEKVICCDPNMIERILLNLISNSLKFTNAGGFIYINVYDKGDKVVFSVRDTGIGMPKDKLDIIFDRFSQIDTSLNRNQEGSGLGLSIVKALVEAHNGKINVCSEPSKGTEFVIEIPAAVLCEDDKKNNKDLLTDLSDSVQKVNIEFSDIYSIRRSNWE